MVARATETTNTVLIDALRRLVRDPLLDRAGNTNSKLRFVADEVQDAIKHALMYIQREMRQMSPADAYVRADGTYTADAVSVAMPSGVGFFDPIVKIENITDSTRPLLIPSMPFDEIERYAVSQAFTPYVPSTGPFRCCLVEGATPGERHIMIRPRPRSALSIRVWRVAAPLIWGTGESHPLAAQWEDLILLLAAQELLRSEGFPPDLAQRLAMVLEQLGSATRSRQPRTIRRKRTGIS